MTGWGEEFDGTVRLLHQLPEREYALYRLGMCLHMSFKLADINRTPADRAYVEEVAETHRRSRQPGRPRAVRTLARTRRRPPAVGEIGPSPSVTARRGVHMNESQYVSETIVNYGSANSPP